MRFIVSTFLWDMGADRTVAPVIVCTERVWKFRAAGANSQTRSQTLQISFFIPVSASLIYGLPVIGPNVSSLEFLFDDAHLTAAGAVYDSAYCPSESDGFAPSVRRLSFPSAGRGAV